MLNPSRACISMLVILCFAAGCDAPYEPVIVAARPARVDPLVSGPAGAARPPSDNWLPGVQGDMVRDEIQALSTAVHRVLFDHVPGYQTGQVAVRPTFDLHVMSDTRVEGRLSTDVTQTMNFSDTDEYELVDSHLLHEETGWFTSSDDCRRTIAENCQRICREARRDEGNRVTWLFDGARRDVCMLKGDLIATTDRGRAQWCAAYAHHPAGCTRPQAQIAHPIADCTYHGAQVAIQVTTEVACTLDRHWSCDARTHLASCQVVSYDGSRAPMSACDAMRMQFILPWGAARGAAVARQLADALGRAYVP